MTIRPPFADEREYVINSWRESYRFAPGGRNSRWRDYSARATPMINAILDREDTRVLVKAIEDVIVGWICFARGRHADTVHWVQTRYKITPAGATLRRHGTMAELVDAAELKPFVAYTLRGEAGTVAPDGEFAFRGKGHRIGISSSDAMISKWLMAKRDIGSAYINLKEWMAR